MKPKVLLLVSLVLAGFAGLALVTQTFDRQCSRHFGVLSVPQFAVKVVETAGMTNQLVRDAATDPFFAECRKLDIVLPTDARIYMGGMLGLTNLHRGLLYHNLAYFLFPREIATSLDQPARITRDGFVGRGAELREELVTNGFDVEVAASASTIKARPLRDNLAVRPLVSPDWFPSGIDALVGFLLPLLTALAGLELVRWVFPDLYGRLGWRERLASGLGLGMMAVAALTLGVKMCGFHGHGLVLAVAGLGASAALYRQRHRALPDWAAGFRRSVRNPIVLAGGVLFLLVFAAAGVLGLVESDAVAAWMLKAKILHLHAGNEVIHWFSEPRLAHAHFDYPSLVPALHAATFDSIGRVDEYVTKFWPAWMLLFLVGAVASACQRNRSAACAAGPSPVVSGVVPPSIGPDRWQWLIAFGPSCFLLALVVLPAIRLYVESEGGTLPMIFFASLGLLQCARGAGRTGPFTAGAGPDLAVWGGDDQVRGVYHPGLRRPLDAAAALRAARPGEPSGSLARGGLLAGGGAPLCLAALAHSGPVL